MRELMYNRVLFILHKKTSNSHSFTMLQKKKVFRGFENAKLLDPCSFYAKTDNFVFVLFHHKS